MKKLALVLVAAGLVAFTGCASSEQKAAQGGFATVTTPASELEEIKRDMELNDIPCGIGLAVSNDEMVARTQAADEGRAALSVALKTQVTRYKEQYTKNVSGEAQKIWEEKANEYTDQELVGATVYKTITQFNESEGKFKIYVLVTLNPEIVKKALMAATGEDEEYMLRAQSADMQARMDKAAAAYKEKYSK
ncbi:MAG: hypothetical protein HUK21_11465 [Fibrobacteraceae bacterium]|nr:hypothetical protein [Fibrobacteraceae bacterium]